MDLGTNRTFYLPRLPAEYYQGDAVVHWTFPVAHRGTGWLNEEVHAKFREFLLHTAARYHLVCPAYCLMNDHLHLVLMGLHLESDQRKAATFLRTYLEPALKPQKFQHQPHDHVLKEHERKKGSFARTCSYILNNPVRAELAVSAKAWPYSGALIPGYPTLHPIQEGYWRKFWALYAKLRVPGAGEILRPPL